MTSHSQRQILVVNMSLSCDIANSQSREDTDSTDTAEVDNSSPLEGSIIQSALRYICTVFQQSCSQNFRSAAGTRGEQVSHSVLIISYFLFRANLVVEMEHWLWILLAALLAECHGEDSVDQTPSDLSAAEGHSVTLGCTYNTSATTGSDSLFWYKKAGNDNRPTFILSQYNYGGQGGKTEKEFEERFSSTLDSNSRSVPLTIQKLQPSDSAVYYCALKPESNAYKLIYGTGTSLTITTSEVYEPSYYLLDENDKKVCLATGFSQHDQHKNSTLFSSTTPARISGDSLFSQVAFNASEHNCTAAGGDGGSVSCEDKMKPDPTVNLVSVTVLGLRLIFLKTIVFNVFLTFRLWHSR